jgi:DNA-binding transcriptional MerR regulator
MEALMEEISIAQAARLSGKSQATIRRWAAQKLVPARKTDDGHWVFTRAELIAHLGAYGSELSESRAIKVTSAKPHKEALNRPLIDAHVERIKTLESLLEREQRLNDELREQLKGTTAEVFKLTAELRSFLSKETKSSPTQWIRTKVQGAFSK